jgi:hypothetical protein
MAFNRRDVGGYAFKCFASFLDYKAIIFPHSINLLVFLIEIRCVLCGVSKKSKAIPVTDREGP